MAVSEAISPSTSDSPDGTARLAYLGTYTLQDLKAGPLNLESRALHACLSGTHIGPLNAKLQQHACHTPKRNGLAQHARRGANSRRIDEKDTTVEVILT